MKDIVSVEAGDWVQMFGTTRLRILDLSNDQGQSALALAAHGKHIVTAFIGDDEHTRFQTHGVQQERFGNLQILDESSSDVASELARNDLIVWHTERRKQERAKLRDFLKVAKANMRDRSFVALKTHGFFTLNQARIELRRAGFCEMAALGVHPNHTNPRVYVPLQNWAVAMLFNEIYQASGVADLARTMKFRVATALNTGPLLFRSHLILAKPGV